MVKTNYLAYLVTYIMYHPWQIQKLTTPQQNDIKFVLCLYPTQYVEIYPIVSKLLRTLHKDEKYRCIYACFKRRLTLRVSSCLFSPTLAGLFGHFVPSGFALLARILGRFAHSGFVFRTRILSCSAPLASVLRSF